MASKKRTEGTTPLYQELPTELVDRLRDFARRDQRTLKVELVRAIELLLATYDRPVGAGARAGVDGLSGSPSTPLASDLKATEERKAPKGRRRSKGK